MLVALLGSVAAFVPVSQLASVRSSPAVVVAPVDSGGARLPFSPPFKPADNSGPALLCGAVLSLAVLGTSFESFLARADGRWRGAAYTWTPTEPSDSGALELGVAPGFI